ncbi:secretory carrier-associated membrane protein 3 isoform X1 [Huso huso]|uniref:Secretory carrier-associated membrane protein n=1 Tax=Huso huso TaxID=61971 RepID=A0ABR0YFZ6_HUSHU
MSQYTQFPEPTEAGNPFQDPAVTQHHTPSTGYATLDLYNPFDSSRGPPPPYESAKQTPPPAAQPPPQQPAAPQPKTPTEPRNYGSYSTQPQARSATAAATAELLRRQEELEKKAADLERRERELQSAGLGKEATRQNNWPPFPSFCPIQPCFYQDISVEIGQDFQRTVSTMYYFWMFSGCTLIFNFIANLAFFCVNTSAGVGLGLAILWILIFTPCSFLCWYRPMYKAFRSDSSFNFFFFFFVFFVQVCLYVMQAVGIPNWGFSGWIVSLAALKVNVAVAVIMLLTAVMFTGTAVMGVIMLKKIHSLYRRTGASFQKAQAEFTTGVLSNEAVRTAAASAATGAAQGAFRGN